MNTAMHLQLTSEQSFQLFDFSHVYQPIFALETNAVYGYESLIRSPKVHNPELLFSAAKQHHKLFELDMYSIVKSVTTFNECFPTQAPLISVNIFPSTLLEPAFLWKIEDMMKRINLVPEQIIFEMNEAESVLSLTRLLEVIRYLKRLGYKIALDDFGKGQSSLRIALELEPDTIKLDRYFCTDLDQSPKKQKFLDWITSYFISEGVAVTLEGIEKESELLIAKQAGVQFGQGYLLGRPEPMIQPLSK